LFVLALLLFGPKRLPVLARELGKWIGEFRRASNEFKLQMEEELRTSEQADRAKEIAAMEAAAPVTPALEPAATAAPAAEIAAEAATGGTAAAEATLQHAVEANEPMPEPMPAEVAATPTPAPLPIAEAGELKIMPPATGLPTPRKSALGGLLSSIPAKTEVRTEAAEPQPAAAANAEAVMHAD